jgi:hypothetical protein
LQKGHIKSAISIIVTGALSGPLLGARTGSKLTLSAARTAVPMSRENESSIDRKTDLFIFSSPFCRIVKIIMILEYLIIHQGQLGYQKGKNPGIGIFSVSGFEFRVSGNSIENYELSIEDFQMPS